MQITFNTSEASTGELTALIALCASLGGRLPAAGYEPNRGERPETVVVPDEDAHAEINDGRRGPPHGLQDASSAEESGSSEAPPPPPPATDPDSARDSAGLPWDGRIHSESRATIADGTWRKRRGVDDATYAAVMAELQGNAPPPPAEPTAAPAEQEVPPPPAADPDPVPNAPTEASPEPAASAPVAGNDGQFAGFPDFVQAVSKFKKSYVELNDLATTLGVPAFKDMKDHADKWEMFYSMLG